MMHYCIFHHIYHMIIIQKNMKKDYNYMQMVY